MELPNASKLLLIEIPSLSRPPTAFVFLILSLPARSTRWNLDDVEVPGPAHPEGPRGDPRGSAVVTWRVKVQMAWERDDVAFMAVVPVALAFVATSSNLCDGILYYVILDHFMLGNNALY
jgi:hypothetical protein